MTKTRNEKNIWSRHKYEIAMDFMKNPPDYLNGIILDYNKYREERTEKWKREQKLDGYKSQKKYQQSEKGKKYLKEYNQRPDIKEKNRVRIEKRYRQLTTVSFTGYVLPIESVHHHSNNCCVFDFPINQHRQATCNNRTRHRKECRLLLETLWGKDFIHGCETGEWR